jgi:hypothetical protein
MNREMFVNHAYNQKPRNLVISMWTITSNCIDMLEDLKIWVHNQLLRSTKKCSYKDKNKSKILFIVWLSESLNLKTCMWWYTFTQNGKCVGVKGSHSQDSQGQFFISILKVGTPCKSWMSSKSFWGSNIFKSCNI